MAGAAGSLRREPADEDKYVLEFQGFESEAAGRDALGVCRSAFAWLALELSVPVVVEPEMDTVVWAEDPEAAAQNLARTMGVLCTGPVHGLASGDCPAMFPTDRRPRFLMVGNVGAVIGHPAARVADAFASGAELPNAGHAYRDPQLALALDLFRAQLTAPSPRVRLMLLVMSLEALCTKERRPESVVAVIEQWLKQFKGLRPAFTDPMTARLSTPSGTRSATTRAPH